MVVPQLLSPYRNGRRPGGRGGRLAWPLARGSGRSSGPSSLAGDAAARRVWGCAHVMKRGKNKGEEEEAKRWLFFFFSFKEFAASASPSFAVWAGSEEDDGRGRRS